MKTTGLMTVKRIYISGPMTGIKGFNIKAFDLAAKDLRNRGFEVVSPGELDDPKFRKSCMLSNGKKLPQGVTKGDLIGRDIKVIYDDEIEALAMLPGWTQSDGAVLETLTARLLSIPVLSYPMLHPISKIMLETVHAQAGLYDEF